MGDVNYKQTIEAAGGKFISMHENTVFFWNENETRVLSLYAWACTPETVALTLKNCREPVVGFEPLEATEKVP